MSFTVSRRLVGLHAAVTCQDCGSRTMVARPFLRPEVFRVTCPVCEALLVVELSGDDFGAALRRLLLR